MSESACAMKAWTHRTSGTVRIFWMNKGKRPKPGGRTETRLMGASFFLSKSSRDGGDHTTTSAGRTQKVQPGPGGGAGRWGNA